MAGIKVQKEQQRKRTMKLGALNNQLQYLNKVTNNECLIFSAHF